MPSQEIDRLNLSVGVTNTPKTLRNIESLTTALSKLDDILTKVSAHGGIDGAVSGDKKSGGKKGGGGKRKPSHTTSLLSLAKLGATIHMARRLGRAVAYIAQAGADYTETLNLWETAMGNNLDTATKFVDKMNEAYGVSEKTLMNAQATFKNMLGSLGQISDETAYRLSEGVTQMALDYASLYNQTFEQAMVKFQAALAGQVRPIRSVSGFDITENTLFQLYQSLGGTKTMRQLSRTEKQLLSIYAIFQQMEASGTTGDLAKTMESFANQSRVAAESFQEILQYSGVLLTHWAENVGIMKYLNAALILTGMILKTIAERSDAIKHFGDPFGSVTDGANGAIDATEQLKGKLTDFDKFRSLSSPQDNALGIDEKLLDALTKYNSILSEANMEARKLAESWAEWWLDPDSENGLTVQATVLLEVLKLIAATLAALGGAAIIGGIRTLSTVLGLTGRATAFLVVSFGTLIYGITSFISAWDDMGGIQKAIGILAALAGVITAIAIGIHATTPAGWIKAISIGALVAGGGMAVASNLSKIGKFADGGLPDKGSMFIAGEAGAELVTNMGGGQSGVMNMEQLENAVARGMLIGLSSVDLRDDRPINVNIDGQRFFTASRDIYRRNGYDVSAVR